MPVSPQCAGGYNIHLIACWLLLLLYPAKVSSGLNNCSFIDGHILEFVCTGFYDRTLRLQYKDRIPALEAPYAIWQRADYLGSSMLLIVFYEGPLSNCFHLVFDDGKFYCDGRNYPMEIDDTILVHCMPFTFTYADDLHKKCKRSRKTYSAESVSSVFVYMETNLIPNSRSTESLCYSNLLFIFTLLISF